MSSPRFWQHTFVCFEGSPRSAWSQTPKTLGADYRLEALANSAKAGNAPLITLPSPRSAKHAVGSSPNHKSSIARRATEDRHISDFFSKPYLRAGAPEKEAIRAGLSRKSYWRLSRTMATHMAMSNQWLAEQGLISIQEEWIRIHYPATAR